MSKPCSFCKETNCIASGNYKLSETKSAFVAIRLDMEFNQIDAEFGIITEDGENMEAIADWSDALDIKYCPMCGRLLPKTNYME